MTTSNSFLLLPIRVLACALDPRKLHATSSSGSLWKWSWNQPDYSGLTTNSTDPQSSLWPSLFNAPKMTKPTAGKKSEAAELAREVGRPPPLKNESRGVCVSWNVPPGWSRLPTDDDAVTALPLLPDRWLIVRLARKTHGRDTDGALKWATESPAIRTWVIDPGVVVEDPTSATVLDEDEGTKAVHVGAVYGKLEDVKTHTASEKRVPLRIQGSEHSPDFTFAAFAPSNLNNLSFIDPLDDSYLEDKAIEGYALSYVVLGWYRQHAKDDPIAKFTTDFEELRAARAALGEDPLAALPKDFEDLRRRLLALGLDPVEALLDAETNEEQALEKLGLKSRDDVPRGNRSVFHGMVAYVDYFNPKSYFGPSFGGPQSTAAHADQQEYANPLTPTIGFGVTAEQALARALSKVSTSDADNHFANESARFLEDLLTDRLWTLDALGSTELKRRAEVASGFRSVPSGTEWKVAPARETGTEKTPRTKASSKKTKPEEPRQAAFISLTPEQRKKLHALNERQHTLDETSWKLAWAVENLYACWWLRRTEPSGAPTEALLRAFTANYRTSILAIRADAKSKEVEVETLKSELAALLKTVPDRKLVLEKAEAPHFFVPREPAVALMNISPSLPTRALPGLGRTAAQVATQREGGQKPSKDAWLNTLKTAFDDESLTGVLASLLVEASLVEEAVSDVVRHRSKSEVPTDMKAWRQRTLRVRKDLGEQVNVSQEHEALKIVLHGGDPKRPTVLGDLCTVWSQQPWVPLFLDWEAEWAPNPEVNKKTLTLQGRTILAHRPQTVIRSRRAALDRSLHADSDQQVKLWDLLKARVTFLDEAERADVVAQTLSGIDQQLLARNDALPRVMPSADDAVFKDIHDLLGQTSLGPIARKPESVYREPKNRLNFSGFVKDEFYPTRQGALAIKRVWVVDRFGQAFALEPTPPATSPPVDVPRSALQSESNVNLGVKLNRCLLEATRLSVRFEMPEDSSSRVRGWILPNLLDKSLVVYDERCTPLGFIYSADADVRWQAVRADPTKSVTEVVKDSALQAFVSRLVSGGPTAKEARRNRFKQLLKQIDDALPRTQPTGSQERFSSASLLGRPLALVRAMVSVERKGGPIFDPRWLSNDEFRKGYQPNPASTSDPGVLGDGQNLPVDGAVGPITFRKHPPLDATLKKLFANPKVREVRGAVSVSVGSRYIPDDGVIGYYLDGDDIQRTTKVDSKSAPKLTLEVPGFEATSPTKVDFLLDPRGKIHLEADILPACAVELAPEWYEDDLRRLPAVLRVTSLLVGSPDELKAPDAGDKVAPRRRIDLPLPAGSVKAPTDLSEAPKQTPKDAADSPRPSAQAVEPASEVLLRIRGASEGTSMDLLVDPVSPTPTLPVGEVAAVDGFLIV